MTDETQISDGSIAALQSIVAAMDDPTTAVRADTFIEDNVKTLDPTQDIFEKIAYQQYFPFQGVYVIDFDEAEMPIPVMVYTQDGEDFIVSPLWNGPVELDNEFCVALTRVSRLNHNGTYSTIFVSDEMAQELAAANRAIARSEFWGAS